MAANEPKWTPERVELLKAGFEAGLSCREIAADISMSRNAVIGKLSRLNLTRGKGGDLRRPAGKHATEGQRPRTAPRTVSRLRHQIRVAFCAASPPPADDEPIHDGHRCSLLELSDERCRWPINTPGADDFRFCGNTPIKGLPYCASHTRLAYRPSSHQRAG
jgi:GcrA cell cycle regulator